MISDDWPYTILFFADGDYSNQGSSPSGGHSSLEQSSSLDQGRGGVGLSDPQGRGVGQLSDQYQYPTDDTGLRLGKVSATPDTNTTKNITPFFPHA